MKRLSNFGVVLAVVAFLSVTLTSCHRYGCPNQITQIEQPVQQEADLATQEDC